MDAENKPKQKNFDQWLDSVLQARVNTQPRVGIEERVLARLAAEPARKVWWPVMAVAGAAVVVIALAIALMSPSPHAPPLARSTAQASAIVSGVTSATHRSQVPRAAVIAAKPKHRAMVASRKAVARRPIETELPKLAAFPTPRPETLQERLLYRLAARPDALQTASLNLDSPIRELSIPELKIDPMEGTPPDNSRQ